LLGNFFGGGAALGSDLLESVEIFTFIAWIEGEEDFEC